MTDRIVARLEKKWELQTRERLERAVEKIAADADLRFLFRDLLGVCGYGSAPAVSDSLTMARDCGKLAVAEYVLSVFRHTDPSLLPTLILETSDEQLARDAEYAARLASANNSEF